MVHQGSSHHGVHRCNPTLCPSDLCHLLVTILLQRENAALIGADHKESIEGPQAKFLGNRNSPIGQ